MFQEIQNKLLHNLAFGTVSLFLFYFFSNSLFSFSAFIFCFNSALVGKVLQIFSISFAAVSVCCFCIWSNMQPSYVLYLVVADACDKGTIVTRVINAIVLILLHTNRHADTRSETFQLVTSNMI